MLSSGCERKPSVPTVQKSGISSEQEAGSDSAIAQEALSKELTPLFALIVERRTGPARVRLRRHLDQHPDDGQACFLFGLSYHREKRYGEAKPWFEQALSKSPEYAVTRHFLGWTLYYMGQPDEARQSFERYLRANPNEHDSHFALGLIALDADELEDAERLLLRAISLQTQAGIDDDAALSRAHTRLGEVYEKQDRLDDARRELELGAKLYPDHYETLYKLYRVLVKLGETDQAQRVHEQYIATRERIRPGTSFPE